jgi:hypothetical protein
MVDDRAAAKLARLVLAELTKLPPLSTLAIVFETARNILRSTSRTTQSSMRFYE